MTGTTERARVATIGESGADLDRLAELVARARRRGADAADALLVRSQSVSLAWRLGALEKLERAESVDLGLRVFRGKRQAIVATTEITAKALEGLLDRALAMAANVPEDPHCGLAAPEEIARGIADLDLCDPLEPSVEALRGRAAAAEDAARAVAGITNSEGAEADWSRADVALAASNGFAGRYAASHHGLGVSVLAGSGTAMERDYDQASATHASELEDAAAVGRRAGERAVGRLHPRKAESRRLTVVYDPRVAGGLLGHLAAAINGAAVARGTSFLKDRLGAPVFAPGITVRDDPTRRRGLRSKPFDGEGLPTRARDLVADGVLTGWLLDLRSARQLGFAPTGNASRGIASAPSPAASNLYLLPGAPTPADLIADIAEGFYVTELIGFGVNGVTGDYSRGASGFMIERGELAHPVSEVTIAGNLKDMYRNLAPANDLVFRFGVDSPTVRVDGMTLAGR